MRITSNQLRKLIQESLAGFIKDAESIRKDKIQFDDQYDHWALQNQSKPDKSAMQELKRIYNQNADRQFLSSLNTVHWAESPSGLLELRGMNKDELSCTMSLPSDELQIYTVGHNYGLWVKGWITYATNNEDQLFSGYKHEYAPGTSWTGEAEWSGEKLKGYEQQLASSGINKLPHAYPSIDPGNENLSSIMLNAETWKPQQGTNEALVDNWQPMAIVVRNKSNLDDAIGIARHFTNLSVVDLDKNVLHEPAKINPLDIDQPEL